MQEKGRGDIMLIILLSWMAIILIGISWKKDVLPPLDKNQATAIRGISAIEIMIGHIGVATGSLVLFPNRKAGILFVGIFFLLSGYGLALSADKKADYMDSFLLKKSTRLILPAYVVYAAYILISTVYSGGV